nr:MAG TPA: hypothetical protein [Caudoviricetes sp.]
MRIKAPYSVFKRKGLFLYSVSNPQAYSAKYKYINSESINRPHRLNFSDFSTY